MNNKETTIYDIAEYLKISPATVSRSLKDHPAISKKTKKLVHDTAKQLGYRSNTFASNLRRMRTNTLGVIVPRLNSSFMSDIIAGMEKIANEAGYNLIISQSLEKEQKEITNALTMFNNRVDGLLVSLAYDTKNINHFIPFIDKNIPIIFFDRIYNHEKCSSIVIDNIKAAYEVNSHLISQGCKNILHVTGNLLRSVYADRLLGYKQALDKHGMIFSNNDVIITDLSPEAGILIANTILNMSVRPDAIFFSNDMCAATCMHELKKHGIKIPNDIAVAGFNNDPIARVIEPGLTTIDYKGFEMGEVAVKNIINHLNQQQPLDHTQTIVLRHELIIRNSSIKK